MSNHLTDALDQALARYGTYTYGDKGAAEVMDVDVLLETLVAQPADQVIGDMAVLAEHEHGAVLYEELFATLVENAMHPDADDLYERLPCLPGGVPLPQRQWSPRPIETDDLGGAPGL